MEFDPAERNAKENYFFLTSAIAPRPIAWVTTKDPKTGIVNAAPFSWFQAVCADPPMVMLAILDRADGTPKDTIRNLRASGECVINAATRHMADQMVATSHEYAPDQSEIEHVDLTTDPSREVAPPRLRDSPLHMECRLHDIRRLGRRNDLNLAILQVVHVAIDDDAIDDHGNLDAAKVPLLARLGGTQYLATEGPSLFSIRRPRNEDRVRTD